MRKIAWNFLKADIRMPHLMFWDWFFPVILIAALGTFIGEEGVSRFLLPGLLALFLMQSIIFSIPYRLAQYNEVGITKFIKEKGSISKLILGFFESRLVILVLQTAIVILIGVKMMRVELAINWLMIFISFMLTVTIFMLISTILGLVLKSQNAALGASQAIYFILIGISGIVYPIEKSPELLRKISVISPLKYISLFWESALYGEIRFATQDTLALIAMLIILGMGVVLITKRERKK